MAIMDRCVLVTVVAMVWVSVPSFSVARSGPMHLLHRHFAAKQQPLLRWCNLRHRFVSRVPIWLQLHQIPEMRLSYCHGARTQSEEYRLYTVQFQNTLYTLTKRVDHFALRYDFQLRNAKWHLLLPYQQDVLEEHVFYVGDEMDFPVSQDPMMYKSDASGGVKVFFYNYYRLRNGRSAGVLPLS